MRKHLIIGSVLVLLLIVIPSGHANSTIFFDDFLSSGFPVQWSDDSNGGATGVSQSNGYATLVGQRADLGTPNILDFAGMVGNTSIQNSPINSATPDGQFILMSWKMQPFNMTAQPSPVNKIGEVMFGFSIWPTANLNSAENSIYFDLWTSDLPSCGSPGNCSTGSKSAIFLDIASPMAGAAKCFTTGVLNLIAQQGGCQPAPQYSPTVNPIDLNNPQHIFTIEMRLYPVSHTSWVAFTVDSMAWMNITQKACSCIDQTAAGGSYLTMYPFVKTAYFAGNGGCCINVKPSQSLATNIDWVLVTDYIPATLPVGQLLFSNISPPPKLPQPYNAFGPSDSLVAFMVFEANRLAPGNIYAGGLLLTGIIVTVIAGTLGAIIWRLRKGMREMGFMWSLSSLGIVFFMFYCGIVPLWLPVIQTIISAGIVFGIVKTGSPSSGGYVPD